MVGCAAAAAPPAFVVVAVAAAAVKCFKLALCIGSLPFTHKYTLSTPLAVSCLNAEPDLGGLLYAVQGLKDLAGCDCFHLVGWLLSLLVLQLA